MGGSMKELEVVVLRRTLPEAGLVAGVVGAVGYVSGEDALEVEFVTGDGTTLTVESLGSEDLRCVDAQEVIHVRTVGPDRRPGPAKEPRDR